ncbi:MAG: hypothetical protein KVP17_003756 [Porospora cf. gigantea B]|uniref:uncharacterized protein n=1 Tax=Porospora cf. gigantea B TaxID=2853592 RepID=UPI0035719B44|nr:MAG: hypothetical protein KVP17_003756 [Porospora cf. gigantea B]
MIAVDLFSATGLLTDETMRKILVIGGSGGGKSSMYAPHEVLHLKETDQCYAVVVPSTALVKLAIVDMPGHVLSQTSEVDPTIFEHAAAVTFVVDLETAGGSSDIQQGLAISKKVRDANPEAYLYFLLHKSDMSAEENAREVMVAIRSRLDRDGIRSRLQFFSTSIYDKTIYVAWSTIVRRLVPSRDVLEELLSTLVHCSGLETGFLIDLRTRLTMGGVCTRQQYSLASETLGLAIEMSDIYRPKDLPVDQPTRCFVQLTSGECVYLREVAPCLAVVCVVREENFDRQHLVRPLEAVDMQIDFNVQVFQRSLVDLYGL